MLLKLKRFTLQDQIDAVGGPTHGFDYLRITLAFAVVFWHTITFSYGREITDYMISLPGLGSLHRFILPMFFALSGFLVAGSLFRVNIKQFIALRVIRIFPALGAEIMLSALLLGPLVTTVSWREYFSDHLFFSYFLNIVGWIHYYLPGVFLDNPFPRIINGQLWTIPFELECYIALTILSFTPALRKRRLFFLVIVALVAVATVRYLQNPPPATANIPGRSLVVAFLAGVCVFLYRDVIPFDARLFWVCLVLSALLLASPALVYLSIFPLVYVTAYLGLCHPKRNFLIRGGDYSYGVYLYHSPILQALVLMVWIRQWPLVLLLGVPLTVLFAMLSWTYIEYPLQKQKGRVLRWLSNKPDQAKATSDATS